jgi:hypothetical protein
MRSAEFLAAKRHANRERKIEQELMERTEKAEEKFSF